MGALKSVKEELTALLMMELQNRLVLNQVTAASGGVCAPVGSSCCAIVSEDDADGGVRQTGDHEPHSSSSGC